MSQFHRLSFRVIILLSLLLVISIVQGQVHTCLVTNLNDSGAGSLREAINCASSNPNPSTVEFQVAGTINLESSLPSILIPGTIIDGRTAPGYSGDPVVTLNGPTVQGNVIEINTHDSEIWALKFVGFGVVGGNVAILIKRNNNVIAGNYIGTDGSIASSNGGGITISGGSGNIIGGTSPSERNVISGNRYAGIGLRDLTNNNIIQGNYIGTDASGSFAIGNGSTGGGDGGILMIRTSNNQILDNVISGNHDDGMELRLASYNIIQGNLIGTNAQGTAAIPNAVDGLDIRSSSFNTVGSNNVISGNGYNGVAVEDTGSTGNIIQGNFIGTDITGTLAIGNTWYGIEIMNAVNTTVGGNTSDARNIISGNRISGVRVEANNNHILGNYVGTDVTGTFQLGNNGHGIIIERNTSNNRIGGRLSGEGNVISGNGSRGLILQGTGTVAEGNLIGLSAIGLQPVPNGTDGVSLSNDSVLLGGLAPGSGNVIAYNRHNGVLVSSQATGAGILSNQIFSNRRLGIEINSDFPGVTPNDPGDTDVGSNNLQNFPVIQVAEASSTGVYVEGILDSLPNISFTIQLFASSTCDPSGYGEGERFLTTLTAITDSSGLAQFTVTSIPATLGEFITATATDPGNNTSEFSACLEVAPPSNQPPIADDVTFATNEDSVLNEAVTATDPDGDILFFATVSTPVHGSLNFISDGTFTYTPHPDFNGTDSFTFKANDGTADSTNVATVTINIEPVNDPPSFIIGADQTATEDSGSQTVQGWITQISSGPLDESDQIISFEVSNDNNALFTTQPGVDLDGTLSFTPAPNAYGSASVSVQAVDNGGIANSGIDRSAIQIAIITVTPVNDIPSVVSPGDQTSSEDTSVTLQINASDVDGDMLSFTASGLPNGLTIDSSSGLISGYLDFDTAQDSPYSVSISVSDPLGPPIVVSFTWNVVNVNRQPLVNPIADQISTEQDFVSVSVSATDPDNDTLQYNVSGLPNGVTINSMTGLISGTIGAGASQNSPYAVTVSVTDAYGASVLTNFNWTVNPLPVSIIINAGGNDNCIHLDGHGVIPVTLYGSATFDAAQVDAATISLSGLAVRMVGNGKREQAHVEDANGDGYPDLVIQIEDNDQILDPGQTTAILTGNYYDGTSFEGTGSICVVQ